MAAVGINGFGRIGRMCLRACIEKGIEVKQINDPFITTEYMVYLYKYDSTHGPCKHSVESTNEAMIVNDQTIKTSQEKDPSKIKWKNSGVVIVIESTGVFTSLDKASMHLEGGAKRVIITAPAPDVPMFIYGVNHCSFDHRKNFVISGASCTTNCAAPIAKIMNDNFEVVELMITSVHATTAMQKTVDGPTGKVWRDGRGCMQNIIPSSTGAAKCLAKVLPEFKDKVSAIAFRVPVPNVSLCDMTFRINKPANYEDVKKVMKQASEDEFRGILHYTEDDVVSSDFNHTTYSCVFDAKCAIPQTSTFIKVVAWYDNEYGYAHRIIDLIKYIKEAEMGKECSPRQPEVKVE